ncbi:zinc finger domain-containing protein [Nocardia nova]|uniref:zinc finger domain-containing protein n=1 Tax=Nocardia nova TaxID=37330 RepID=UPI0011B01E79|nr:hypothetical protein [Nocardia nova]
MPAPVIATLPAKDRISLPVDLREQHQRALTVPCPYCLALPGQRCHRPDGSHTQHIQLRFLHPARDLRARRATETVDAAARAHADPGITPRGPRGPRPVAPRPLLYLDVDGPLYPWAAKPQPPAGFDHLLLARHPDTVHTPGGRSSMRLWLNPSHGRQLIALSDSYDLVWASRWSDDANTRIRPLLGLPRLPVLAWDHDSDDRLAEARALVDHAGRRPFVWVSSRIEPAGCHYINSAHTAPAYLYPIAPQRGLQTSDFVTLHAATANLTHEQRPARWPTQPLLAPFPPAADTPPVISTEAAGAIQPTTLRSAATIRRATSPDTADPEFDHGRATSGSTSIR